MPTARENSVRFILLGSASFLLHIANSDAADNFWTGAVSGDWNTPGNWSLGTVPTNADNARIDISGGSSTPFRATISADVAQVVDILVSRAGLNASSPGILNHTAGTASTGANNWMDVGTDGGSGIYNLANTNTSGGTLTGFGLGSGSINAFRIYVGGGEAGGPGGTGVMNINTTGTVNATHRLFVGKRGTGTLNFDAGTISMTNDLEVGSTAGIGVFKMSGGTLNTGTTGGWVFVGTEKGGANSDGTFDLNGGTFNNTFAGNRLIIGEGNAKGRVNVAGGTLNNDGEMWVGQAGGGNGTFSLTSGTVQVGNWVAVGREGATGTLNVSGGTLTKGGASDSHFIVGSLGGFGTVNQTGGSISTVGSGEVRLGEGSSTALWDLSGGVVSTDGLQVAWAGGINEFRVRELGSMIAGFLTIGSNGTGVFNQSGGSVSVATTLDVQGANGTGTYSLSGGTLSVDTNIDAAAGTFTFTGGKLTRSNAGIIKFDGALTTGSGLATLDLDNNKTFDINGAFNKVAGVTLELTGITIPAWDGVGIDTGSFTLGTVDSIIGTFGPLTDTITGLTINNQVPTTFISEAAGEGATFDPNSQSVYWVQENGGSVTLQYSIVPEPGSMSLLGIAGVALGLRRRRK